MDFYKLAFEMLKVFAPMPIILLITVFFHELAHMLVAMAVGIKVEIFSLGCCCFSWCFCKSLNSVYLLLVQLWVNYIWFKC